MKFKLKRPEDFTEVEGIAYQTIHAYGQLHSDTMIMLIYLESLADNINHYDNLEEVKERILEIIKPFELVE